MRGPGPSLFPAAFLPSKLVSSHAVWLVELSRHVVFPPVRGEDVLVLFVPLSFDYLTCVGLEKRDCGSESGVLGEQGCELTYLGGFFPDVVHLADVVEHVEVE